MRDLCRDVTTDTSNADLAIKVDGQVRTTRAPEAACVTYRRARRNSGRPENEGENQEVLCPYMDWELPGKYYIY